MVKRFKDRAPTAGRRFNLLDGHTRERYIDQMKTQAVAAMLAKEFNYVHKCAQHDVQS